MAVTPLDLLQREFPESRRGYDQAAVRAFLEEARESLEDALREVRTLREQLRERDQKAADPQAERDEVRQTLMVARRLSEDLAADARRQADLLLGEARLQAQVVISTTYDEHQQLVAQVVQLKAQRHRLTADLRAVLEAHRRALEEQERGSGEP